MSATGEKHHDDATTDVVAKPGTPGSDTSSDHAALDPVAERKLLRKLDLTIFPVFFVVYVMAFLDRINISNAAIMGLKKELHLDVGSRFNVALFVSSPSLPSTDMLFKY